MHGHAPAFAWQTQAQTLSSHLSLFIIYLAYLATGQSQQSPQEEFVLDFGHF